MGALRPPSAGQRDPRAPRRVAARGLRRGLRLHAGQPVRRRPASERRHRHRRAVRAAHGTGRVIHRLVHQWLGPGARDLRPATGRPRRPDPQVDRLPEGPWRHRDPCRGRVPGRLVRRDLRPGLLMDRQHVHVRRRGAADRLAVPESRSRRPDPPRAPGPSFPRRPARPRRSPDEALRGAEPLVRLVPTAGESHGRPDRSASAVAPPLPPGRGVADRGLPAPDPHRPRTCVRRRREPHDWRRPARLGHRLGAHRLPFTPVHGSAPALGARARSHPRRFRAARSSHSHPGRSRWTCSHGSGPCRFCSLRPG